MKRRTYASLSLLLLATAVHAAESGSKSALSESPVPYAKRHAWTAHGMS